MEVSGGDAGHRATRRRGPGSGRVHWPDPVTLGRRRTRTARWPFVRPKPEVRRRRSAQWVILRCSEVPPSPRRSPGLSSAGPQAGPQRPSGPRHRGSLPPRERALPLGRARAAVPGAEGDGQVLPAHRLHQQVQFVVKSCSRSCQAGESFHFFSLLNWNVSCRLSVFITSQLAN